MSLSGRRLNSNVRRGEAAAKNADSNRVAAVVPLVVRVARPLASGSGSAACSCGIHARRKKKTRIALGAPAVPAENQSNQRATWLSCYAGQVVAVANGSLKNVMFGCRAIVALDAGAKWQSVPSLNWQLTPPSSGHAPASRVMPLMSSVL